MKKYSILWIDDEHEKLGGLKMQANQEGLKLHPYKSLNTGLLELEYNYSFYDGLLLDGKFFENENDVPGTEDTLNSIKAKDRIVQIPKLFEIFILTGQAEAYDDNTFKKVFKRIYRKGISEDIKQLFNDIKQAADKLPDTQARHNYSDIFDICSNGYLDENVEEEILELLKASLPNNRSELKSMLTLIRSIHESCLIKLAGINVIPNASDKFRNIINHLSGNKSYGSNWKPTSIEYQTEEIKNLNEWIYFTCGTYIHNLDKQYYDGYMISNYAMESLRHGLLEFLLWFNKTYEEYK